MLSLASSSSIRADILTAAGIPFQTVTAKIDEDSVQRSLEYDGASPRDIVDTLAEFKARKGSTKLGGLVLGCDQILCFQDQIYGKPADKAALLETLRLLSGQRHDLFTANVLYQDGKPIWRHIGRVKMTMRSLTDDELNDYIDRHWDQIRHCAGGYQVESTPYLFDDIDGDWFDILGLSLDPLRGVLRTHDILKTARPKLAGVFGFPISHSKSPILHGYWLDQLTVPGFYTAIECPPKYFRDTVKLLQKMGFAGANVTLPHKEAALSLADHQTKVARAIGASNTLMFGPDGITADNTDAIGFWCNIQKGAPSFDPTGKTAFVLGAGGAARAIIYALRDAGFEKIVLSNRTRAKADDLAATFGEPVSVLEWDDRDTILGQIDFLVNTTALGMSGQAPLDLNLDELPAEALVTDIVYSPLETDLLAAARAKGCETVDGLGMLLHQAAPGFKAWFGPEPEVDEGLRQAILA